MTNEELVAKIKSGIDIGDNMLQLWQQNKQFIHKIALHYQGCAELEDMEQEGYLALYNAIDGYNPESSNKFLTYAQHWIRHRIVRYIQNNGTVRIPVHECEKLKEYKKLINSFCVYLGRKPSRYEIAQNMGLSIDVVTRLEKVARMSKLRSLDRSLSEDDAEGGTVGDLVASEVDVENDVLEDVQLKQLKDVLWQLVDALPDQQGQVIRQRFQDNKTLKATGESLGVTIEQVRQIESKAMRNLRCSRSARMLRSFLAEEEVYSMGITGNGVAKFNTTFTSSTERAALKMHEESVQMLLDYSDKLEVI